ncbi:DUF992 domain-containing protein [Methylobacterium gnaphalii]|uniref:DUF992 domain-containing protein n=1 Tax=Methylobacterium gnaphalii TaxID=1010610 RepID=A0A512JQC4_9HYPH|nr:DUF992 domain-containing protein [Methylobacterium gnaphalii]GEP12157.1 hypothetical protein MGN01_40020 [Methylobacterium gnaphalii]GJD70022.1 hypothetical protein MMMDOFMJ_2962 [Methylobacterium gnaphalii]GLS48916.1 hypothetical protein GCM10007885_17630 [Methylobacterium gnaphalii]
MRSIAPAILGIALGAGASYAHANRTEAVEQVVGTLTCVTRPELSIVFGRSPFADCAFIAERGDVRQAYQAVLRASDPTLQVEAVQKIVWRVRTRDGSSRPAMLQGAFRAVTDPADRNRSIFAGQFADLEIVSHSRRSINAFARGAARIDLAAVDN